MVRYVGFFREGNESGDPSLYRDSLRSAAEGPAAPDEDRILQYLMSGTEIFSTMGVERDVLDGEKWIGGAGSLVTDGEWVWPVDLVHYLEHYHIALPEEFLARVRGAGYLMKPIDDARIREVDKEVFPNPPPNPWANRKA